MPFHFKFCFCGRLGKPQFLGKCEKRRAKEAPKKKDTIKKYRGDSSKWVRENGLFESK